MMRDDPPVHYERRPCCGSMAERLCAAIPLQLCIHCGAMLVRSEEGVRLPYPGELDETVLRLADVAFEVIHAERFPPGSGAQN